MAAADAALSVVVDSLVSLRRTRLLRLYFPWLFLLLSVLGSALKDLDLVPASYFSSSRNVLNLYLVKLSWGWTLALLAPFLFLPPVLSGRSGVSGVVPSLGRHLLSLAVATSVWYVFTETFFYIEDATGFCHELNDADAANDASNTADVIDVVMKSKFVSKAACRRAGFLWSGWDISGHCFILSYSALVIVEETAAAPVQLSGGGGGGLSGGALRRALQLLYVALNLVVLTWVWMFLCTCVYFHDTQDKLLGTACGLAGWYLTYRVWYPRRWSPGLPSQRQPKERKQRA